MVLERRACSGVAVAGTVGCEQEVHGVDVEDWVRKDCGCGRLGHDRLWTVEQ